ncbi:HD domain-containing protein [Natronosalvus vescus]|uniref:HD domain-containing protein n=1 Tax=Natronosalvus vescus TaxID=2953881 RepID=UPI0020905655|nr:HD domain-containing protein [Natronosalvus vescus]
MLEQIRPIARSYFDGDVAPAHDWHHVERVETNARRLVVELTSNQPTHDVDEQVLYSAVLLHDIGRPGEEQGVVDDHAEWGAQEASAVLEAFDLTDGTVDEIAHCIRAHRFSNDVEPQSIEARLLSDADNLDALGAIGIARVFSYGGERGTTIYDPSCPPAEDDSRAGETSVNHFHKKIRLLPERMYTQAGRALADDRLAVVDAYLESLADEIGAEESEAVFLLHQ